MGAIIPHIGAVRHCRRACGMIDTVAGAGGTPNANISGAPRPHSPEVPLAHPHQAHRPGRRPDRHHAGRGRPAPARLSAQGLLPQPERGYFRLADDGKTLGFMQPVSIDGQPPRMNIYDAGAGRRRAGRRAAQADQRNARDISNFFWKGDDTVLYQKTSATRISTSWPSTRAPARSPTSPPTRGARRSRTICPTTPDHAVADQPQPARPAGVRRLPRQCAPGGRTGRAEPGQRGRLADRPCRQGARRHHQRRPEHHPALPRRRGRARFARSSPPTTA